jgi:outer membrane protein assembly factor BamA
MRSSTRIARGTFMLLAAAALAAPAQAPAQSAVRDSVEVVSLGFAGASAFPEELLRGAIVTMATRCSNPALFAVCLFGAGRERQYLDARTLAEDLVRLRVLYFTRGYRDAAVNVRSTPRGAGTEVTFVIDEGRPVVVSSIGFDGGERLSTTIFGELPLRVAEPFSLPLYEVSRDTLSARLRDLGYASAEILPRYHIPADDPHHAEVVYEIVAGPRARFGEVEIVGTDRIEPAVVERMLTFRSGDLYSQQALLRSQRNLFGLEVFRHAEIAARPLAGDTVIGVRVQVNEGDIHRVRFGVGVSTSEFLMAEGRWTSRSFLGGARRLEIRGRATHLLAAELERAPLFETGRGIYGRISGSATADFAQPWFFDPRNTLRTGLFAERNNLPGVYVRTSRGGYLAMHRIVGSSATATAGYRLERTKLETEDGDVIFCVSLLACAEADIQVLREPHWLAPFSVAFARDRSSSLFNPTRGRIFRIEAEVAGRLTGSDFGYVRAIGELSDYRRVARHVVLASRIRPGWAIATGDGREGLGLHPQKRFFAGGSQSVRGLGQFRLGPRLLTISAEEFLVRPLEAGGAGCSPQAVNAGECDAAALAAARPGAFDVRPVGGSVSFEANAELRFPLGWDKLRGAAFLDAGQVWREPGAVRPRELVWTPGAGIRYFSPIGPIRVDLGYNTQGSERLSVVSTEVWACGNRAIPATCSHIEPGESYDPAQIVNLRALRPQPDVLWNPRRSFIDRLQLHFSIGQAF